MRLGQGEHRPRGRVEGWSWQVFRWMPALMLIVFLAGCRGAEVLVYEVPKERHQVADAAGDVRLHEPSLAEERE